MSRLRRCGHAACFVPRVRPLCVLIETSACSTKTARIRFGRASVMNSYGNDTTRTRPITARLSLHARGTFARVVETRVYNPLNDCVIIVAVIADAGSQKSRRTCRWSRVIKIRLVRGPRLFLVPWYVRTCAQTCRWRTILSRSTRASSLLPRFPCSLAVVFLHVA